MPPLVEHSNDFHLFFTGHEIDRVGESLQQTASNRRMDPWKLGRSGCDPDENVIKFIKEAEPQARLLPLIPCGSVFDVKLCLRPSDEFPHQLLERLPSFDLISSRTSSHGLTGSGLA